MVSQPRCVPTTGGWTRKHLRFTCLWSAAMAIPLIFECYLISPQFTEGRSFFMANLMVFLGLIRPQDVGPWVSSPTSIPNSLAFVMLPCLCVCVFIPPKNNKEKNHMHQKFLIFSEYGYSCTHDFNPSNQWYGICFYLYMNGWFVWINYIYK